MSTHEEVPDGEDEEMPPEFEEFVRQLLVVGLLAEHDNCIAATRDGLVAAGLVLVTIPTHLDFNDPESAKTTALIEQVGDLLTELVMILDEDAPDLHLAAEREEAARDLG